MPEFAYSDPLPTGADPTPYRLVTADGVRTTPGPGGREFHEVQPEALRRLTDEAMASRTTCDRPTWLSSQASWRTPGPAATTRSWR